MSEEKRCDFIGNELQIGDEVVFMQLKYRNLMRGTIKTMAPKSALLGHKKTNTCSTESRQCYKQMIKIVK